jgi:predicted Zn finger-like uncharacterized protein
MTTCPQCFAQLRVKREYLGKSVVCKQCNHRFTGIEASQPTEAKALAARVPPAGPGGEESDRILVTCKNCKTSLSIRRSRIGQVVQCKVCARDVLVEEPRVQPPAAAGCPSRPITDDLLLSAVGTEPESTEGELLEAECQQLRSELEQLRVSHNLATGELERVRPAHDALKAELDATRVAHNSASIELDQLRPAHDALKAELDATRTAHDSAKAELEQLRTAHDALKSDLDAARAAHNSANAGLEQLRPAHDALKAELDATRTAHNSAKAELEQHRTAHDALRTEFEAGRAAHSLASAELEQLRNARKALTIEVSEVRAAHDLAKTRLDQILPAHDALRNELDRLSATRDQILADNQRLRAELESLKAENQATLSREDWISPAKARVWAEERTSLECDLERAREVSERLQKELDVEQQARGDDLARSTAQCDELRDECERLRALLHSPQPKHPLHELGNQQPGEPPAATEVNVASDPRRDPLQSAVHPGESRSEQATARESVAGNGGLKHECATQVRTESRESELASARLEIEKLKLQLRDCERVRRDMSAVLDGMGLRFHMGP